MRQPPQPPHGGPGQTPLEGSHPRESRRQGPKPPPTAATPAGPREGSQPPHRCQPSDIMMGSSCPLAGHIPPSDRAAAAGSSSGSGGRRRAAAEPQRPAWRRAGQAAPGSGGRRRKQMPAVESRSASGDRWKRRQRGPPDGGGREGRGTRPTRVPSIPFSRRQQLAAPAAARGVEATGGGGPRQR